MNNSTDTEETLAEWRKALLDDPDIQRLLASTAPDKRSDDDAV